MNFNTVEFRTAGDAGPLAIVTQPTGATVPRLAPVILRGLASGFVAGYQWYRNGLPINGANGNAYFIGQTTTNNVGNYTLHAFNYGAEVVSDPVEVTLTALLVSIAPSNGTNIVIIFTGVLQSASGLTNVFTDVSPASPSPLVLTNPPGPEVYYRSRN